jgi:hypothetical protein
MYIVTEDKEQYVNRRIIPTFFVSAGQGHQNEQPYFVSNDENEVAARKPQ